MITQNPCRHVGYFLFFKKYFLQNNHYLPHLVAIIVQGHIVN